MRVSLNAGVSDVECVEEAAVHLGSAPLWMCLQALPGPGVRGEPGKQSSPKTLCPQGLPWPSLRREPASWAWAVRKWR